MSTRVSSDSSIDRNSILIDKINQKDPNIKLADVLGIFARDQNYQGRWKKSDSSMSQVSFINQNQGKFRMYADKQTIYSASFSQNYVQHLELQVLNGDYIDKGALFFSLYLENADFVTTFNDDKQVTVSMNSNSTGEGYAINYKQQNILSSISDEFTNITALNMTASITPEQKLLIGFNLYTQAYQMSFQVTGAQNIFVSNLIFATIMIFCSIMSFSSILTILRAIFQLQDNPRKYSFITVMMTNMWDTVLCIVCFMLVFQDQLSLMFYIVPAFLYCLMFTNLQPRFLMMIYQSMMDNDANLRVAICKFNLMHYSSLFALYPIMVYSNFNWVFFIGISCLVFPQIYANGFNNNRPDISSAYYTKYLFSRFIIIIYLKCYPGNMFLLKPDFVLAFLCFILISMQYGLLIIQKKFGSKKVLPGFLLEPVYDYFLHQEFNIEEGVQQVECSICLTPLNQDPAKGPQELQFEPNEKLMKTPCGHKYHSHCLLVWMKIKMQCPQCRFKLPPYE